MTVRHVLRTVRQNLCRGRCCLLAVAAVHRLSVQSHCLGAVVAGADPLNQKHFGLTL